MKQIINGKTYNTDTSHIIWKKSSEKYYNDLIIQEHRHAYITRTGNYFIHHIFNHRHPKHPILDRTNEWLEPIAKEKFFEL